MVEVLQPHRDSPLILHELIRACVTRSTSGRLEGLKREAPGWRKSFGVLNRENTHVNEASLEKGRGVLCSALRWKLKARGVLERFPLLIRPYVRFLLGLLNPESIREHCICQQACKTTTNLALLTPGTSISRWKDKWKSVLRQLFQVWKEKLNKTWLTMFAIVSTHIIAVLGTAGTRVSLSL